MSNKHKDLSDDQLHVCKGHEGATVGTHIVKDETGQQAWEKRPVLFPVLSQADPNAMPPTSVTGDIYLLVQSGVTLNVDTIAWQSGTTVRYTMTGDFSMLVVTSSSDYITITGATNPKHNGTFIITSLDDIAGWVQVSNALVTSAADDESSSPASATTSNARWGNVITNDWVRYNGTVWYGISPFDGVQVYDKNTDSVLTFDGTQWGAAGSAPSASETVEGIIEIATQTETNTGTDDQRAVTPLKLATWWTAIKAAAATISGIWTFKSEKIRVETSGSAFYSALSSAASANQIWTIPNEGDQTFASRAYAESLVVGLWDDRGNYDASGGAYPSSGGSGTAGAIMKGDIWTISVGGTLPTGVVVAAGDTVRALIDTPGNTQANWSVAENNFGFTPENVVNKDTDGTLAANSDTKYASQKAVKTYADAKVADAINNGTTTVAPSQNAVYDALAIHEGEWKTLAHGRAFHIASNVTAAGIYWHNTLGHTSTITGSTGSNTAPSFIYIKSSDFVSSIGLTPKLRIKIHLFSVNNVAPARTFTVGLYPCSGPSTGSTGGVGVRIYDAGKVVSGSDGYSVASPAADTFTLDQYSSVFSLPDDGLYAIACDISGAMAASSGVHILAELQYHFE